MTIAIILFIIGILCLFFGKFDDPLWDLLGFAFVIGSFIYVTFKYYSLCQ